MDKIAIFVIVAIVIGTGLFLIIATAMQFASYQYTILDYNYQPNVSYDSNFNPLYSLTVYVKIQCNVNNAVAIKLDCHVIDTDLTTVTHSQTIQMSKGQVQTIAFEFSNADLHNQPAHKYVIYYPTDIVNKS